jgi:hypothetical protein
MVVSTHPSSQFYQLSFHQHLLHFFLNRFPGTFRDFADDVMTSWRRTSKGSNLLIGHQIVSVAILNFLMRWSFRQRRCVRVGPLSFPWMRRAQSHVSGLFIFGLCHNRHCLLLKPCFSICFLHSMLSSSYPCLGFGTGMGKPAGFPKRVVRVRVR